MLDEFAGVGPQYPSIVPAQGSPLGGDTVTIRTPGITAATTVTFGGVPAFEVVILDDEELSAVTPPGGPGTVEVAVTTAGAGGPVTLSFEYPELSLAVLRADDLLAMTVELVNLDLVEGTLTRRDSAQPAVVVITLPPQHIQETQFPVLAGPPGDPPITGVVAGPSRLVFTVPDSITSLSLDVPTLLGWDGWEVVPPAVVPGYPPPPPGPQTTALELPYRLFLTPTGAPTWTHRTASGLDPVTGQAEVWRTTAVAPALRVTWSPDVVSDAPPGPTLAGRLDANDRGELALPPQDVDSGDLVLSTLGASVDMGVSLSGSGSLADWRQVVADGRDSYVRVVDRGYLLPFGHAAAVTTVSQRGPAPSVGGVPLEAMESVSILRVTQPVVDFDGQFPADRPPLPFRSVRVLTLSTTTVTIPDHAPSRVEDDSGPVNFHLLAEDLSGAAVHLTMPLVYVPNGVTVQTGTYESFGDSAALGGQQVAFVPPAAAAAANVADLPAVADASVLPVSGMSFKLPTVPTVPSGSGPLSLLPQLDQAQVSLPAVDALDAVAGPRTPWSIGYHPAYIAAGLDPRANLGQVFASVMKPKALALPADRAGGLASPAMAIDGLSRSLGPVPNSKDLANGVFQPEQALAAGATLLGGLTLKQLLQDLGKAGGDAFDQTKLPALTHLPTSAGLQTSFTWTPALKAGTVDLGILEIILTADTALSLVAQSTVATDGPPTAVVDGKLTNVTLRFLDAVTLFIDLLQFHTVNGGKTKLTTGKNLDISFVGDLGFLVPLAEALPSDGFADLPTFDVTPAGVTAGFSLGLPAIGVGVISIENVSFSAALSLPFTAPLGLSLAFSDRDHPFLVTVSFIGGGGFFAIDVGTDGIRRIEGSLELGANLSVDLLIVTANVHVLAGFYFGMTTTPATGTAPASTTTSFSAFLRIGGSVDLLGIISVSIELYLALAYDGTRSAIVGTASLTLSVHVLFVTKSLTLSVHKSFPVPGARSTPSLRAASADDPSPVTFDEQLTIDDWQTYCQAFV